MLDKTGACYHDCIFTHMLENHAAKSQKFMHVCLHYPQILPDLTENQAIYSQIVQPKSSFPILEQIYLHSSKRGMHMNNDEHM